MLMPPRFRNPATDHRGRPERTPLAGPSPRAAALRGFSLVEILTVIAIIGILVAIIVPASSVAHTSALRAKTRVQFSQWAMAIESFRQEYGYYPTFGSSDTRWVVNAPGTSTTMSAVHPFHDILAGRRRDGTALPTARPNNSTQPPPENQNPRRIAFINFTEADMFPSTWTDTARRNLLRDAFDNYEIAVLVDKNMDGVIRMGGSGSDYANPPTVRPAEGATASLSPSTTDFPRGNTGGVRASVIFYSAMPRANDSSQLIMSWK